MEKVTVFFCDIIGTFKGKSFNEKIDSNELEAFIQNLNGFMEKDGSDKLIFSFITSANVESVFKESEFLRIHIDNKHIVLGRQYFENGYIEDGRVFSGPKTKPQQIIEYINGLKSTYTVNMVYYADDTEYNHVILDALGHDICSFIPNQGIGISELNELISKEKKIIK